MGHVAPSAADSTARLGHPPLDAHLGRGDDNTTDPYPIGTRASALNGAMKGHERLCKLTRLYGGRNGGLQP